MDNNVIRIDANGTTCSIQAPSEKLPLAWMQQQVGGYIEVMYMRDGFVLVFDEEGRLKGLPRNVRTPCLVGTVLIAKTRRRNMYGMPAAEADYVVAKMDAYRRERQGEAHV